MLFLEGPGKGVPLSRVLRVERRAGTGCEDSLFSKAGEPGKAKKEGRWQQMTMWLCPCARQEVIVGEEEHPDQEPCRVPASRLQLHAREAADACSVHGHSNPGSRFQVMLPDCGTVGKS